MGLGLDSVRRRAAPRAIPREGSARVSVGTPCSDGRPSARRLRNVSAVWSACDPHDRPTLPEVIANELHAPAAPEAARMIRDTMVLAAAVLAILGAASRG